MTMKNITERDLFSIYENNFGMKKTVSDSGREFGGGNVPSSSLTVFSVSKLSQVVRIDEMNKYLIHRKTTNPLSKELWLAVNDAMMKPIRDVFEKIERKKQLALRGKNNKNFLNVEKAKEFPITDLIDFKGRTAKCIFHEDRNPSMHYYPKTNTCYCFSCNTYGDSIKVYQTINNCDFVTAVKALQ